jgi:hypothetical protein
MLRAKGNEEFNKWWKYWMSTLVQNRVVVRHPASGNKPPDVEPTGDASHGNRETPVTM